MIANSTDQSGSSSTTVAPLISTLPAALAAADQARIDRALADSRAPATRAQYRSAWKGWAEWSALNGHATLPAAPLTVAAYLAERTEQGAAASHRAHHPRRDPRRPPSTRAPMIRPAMMACAAFCSGLTRQAGGPGPRPGRIRSPLTM